MKFAKYSPAPDNAIPVAVRTVVSSPAPIVVTSTPAPIALTATPSPIAITTYRPTYYSTTTTTPAPIAAVSYPSHHPIVKNVFIRPHSEPRDYLYDHKLSYIAPNDLNNDLLDVTSREYSTARPPSLHFELPRNDLTATSGSTLHPPIAKYTEQQYSTTVRPLSQYSVQNANVGPVESTTYRPAIRASIADNYRPTPIGVSTARPLLESESISKPFYSNDYKYYAPYYNTDKNSISSTNYKPYDGVSLTNNDGFKYYLPRHYHEEQGLDSHRDGSFGYIDPFGIRRVVYYNVRPGTGFVHRKNNRYVGFNATPYDPRPSIRKKK